MNACNARGYCLSRLMPWLGAFLNRRRIPWLDTPPSLFCLSRERSIKSTNTRFVLRDTVSKSTLGTASSAATGRPWSVTTRGRFSPCPTYCPRASRASAISMIFIIESLHWIPSPPIRTELRILIPIPKVLPDCGAWAFDCSSLRPADARVGYPPNRERSIFVEPPKPWDDPPHQVNTRWYKATGSSPIRNVPHRPTRRKPPTRAKQSEYTSIFLFDLCF